ncbi:hypothetical protein D3C76_1091450 [compost metagenome]
MADVAGEQPLAGQGIAQTAQRVVEGNGQLADFVCRIIGRQGRRQAEQLVTMAYLTRQADHRRHHPARHQPAKDDGQHQAEQKAHDHHSKQHALALFEIALILQ